LRIGIDLGGTKIEGIALAKDGNTLYRDRIVAPKGSYKETLTAIASFVTIIEKEIGRKGTVGIGIPGSICTKTGLIKNANSTWLIGKPLKNDLVQQLQRPVKIGNDADCFVLSEAIDGAGAGYTCVFGAILGTGVGGGFYINGTLETGANRIRGEWGHNRLYIPDDLTPPKCYCGHIGCVETYVSGPALSRAYNHLTGKNLTAKQINDASITGDASAETILSQYEDRLALALSTIINVMDPNAIILGGGLSNLERLYQNVKRKLEAHVFSDTVMTALLPPKFGDSSGVRGAAWLWPES